MRRVLVSAYHRNTMIFSMRGDPALGAANTLRANFSRDALF